MGQHHRPLPAASSLTLPSSSCLHPRHICPATAPTLQASADHNHLPPRPCLASPGVCPGLWSQLQWELSSPLHPQDPTRPDTCRCSVPLRHFPFLLCVFPEIPKEEALAARLSFLTELCNAVLVHGGHHQLLPAHTPVHHCSV